MPTSGGVWSPLCLCPGPPDHVDYGGDAVWEPIKGHSVRRLPTQVGNGFTSAAIQ